MTATLTQNQVEKSYESGLYLIKGIYNQKVLHTVVDDNYEPICEYWERPVIDAIESFLGFKTESELIKICFEQNQGEVFRNLKIKADAKIEDFEFSIVDMCDTEF